ncbi:hypothetical protein AVEN_161132-1 [Araneus ventricosus]|uniref:Uncharacterized protein n=1 Tax=Araneus ventricosus TaxID=182803 RepID=A0A4Y2K4N8_ARAVE|nr:hypothetical protein AVEN_161132-1 [Araneus ventricosus]
MLVCILWPIPKTESVSRQNGRLLHDLLAMGTIMQEPQCLTIPIAAAGLSCVTPVLRQMGEVPCAIPYSYNCPTNTHILLRSRIF